MQGTPRTVVSSVMPPGQDHRLGMLNRVVEFQIRLGSIRRKLVGIHPVCAVSSQCADGQGIDWQTGVLSIARNSRAKLLVLSTLLADAVVVKYHPLADQNHRRMRLCKRGRLASSVDMVLPTNRCAAPELLPEQVLVGHFTGGENRLVMLSVTMRLISPGILSPRAMPASTWATGMHSFWATMVQAMVESSPPNRDCYATRWNSLRSGS